MRTAITHHHPPVSLDTPPTLAHLRDQRAGHGLTWLPLRLLGPDRLHLHQQLHRRPDDTTALTMAEAAKVRQVLSSMPYGAMAHFRLLDPSPIDGLGRHDAVVFVHDLIADLLRLREDLGTAAANSLAAQQENDRLRSWARTMQELLAGLDPPQPPPDPSTAAQEGAPPA